MNLILVFHAINTIDHKISDRILKNFDLNVTKQKKLLKHAMNSNDPAMINIFSKLVAACFSERDIVLNSVDCNAVLDVTKLFNTLKIGHAK